MFFIFQTMQWCLWTCTREPSTPFFVKSQVMTFCCGSKLILKLSGITQNVTIAINPNPIIAIHEVCALKTPADLSHCGRMYLPPP
mmetsp:Transcript_1056/g.3617  ORF Transcript_1056/g.3617 Transcript_1056/m.3617 type:complete len:85 (+) Transcript_1056:31-285(+)